jgi:DNA recombination protein RmuC
MLVVAILGGLIVGAGLVYLALQGQLSANGARIRSLESEKQERGTQLTELQTGNSQLAIENVQLSTSLSEKQQSFERELGQLRETAEASISELRTTRDTQDARLAELQRANEQLNTQNSALATSLNEQKKSFETQIAQLRENEELLRDTFARLSKEALEGNSKSFLELANAQLGQYQQTAKGELDVRKKEVEALVRPINETLSRFDQTVKELEEKRNQAYGSISSQLRSVVEAEQQLRGKAEELASALRGQPTKWGLWGERQLRNVVETAGMSPYCDFDEQLSITDTEGRARRLDLVVNLPNGRRIIVDAKAPIELFMAAVGEQNEDLRERKLKDFVKGIKSHRDELSSKRYWELLPGSPELIVLFLPRESCFSAALEVDDSLLEFSTERPVVVATPTTLIALLRAVAYGWKQEQLADNARRISESGVELYKRLRVFLEHMHKTGRSLDNAVQSFNAATSSLESRLLPQARKINDLGAGDGKPPLETLTIDVVPKQISVAELSGGDVEATA